ncbi:MAG: peptidoglycan bridge formation glycyltransferase FemA/FemB family protein [Treponema sp.]|nr:peptidoglycan bridge formation glycyltransferase FemA/FemB family protein [Treponema sp.]
MTITKKKYLNNFSLKWANVFFDSFYSKPKVDIIYEWQYTQKKGFSQDFYTLALDLPKNEEEILSNFEKNTKYEINRAKTKDNLEIKTVNCESKQDFYSFYNTFASSKKLPLININETDSFIENNIYVIRAAFYEGEPIVYHTYVTANNRARLMLSASLFRDSDNSFKNLVGRANRLLHWEDILYFKEQNFLIYDFGGINKDKKNKETQAINKFKECFGGELIKEYKNQIPLTFKGFLFLLCKRLIGKF